MIVKVSEKYRGKLEIGFEKAGSRIRGIKEGKSVAESTGGNLFERRAPEKVG